MSVDFSPGNYILQGNCRAKIVVSWWNWQTRQLEVLVLNGVGVRVPRRPIDFMTPLTDVGSLGR